MNDVSALTLAAGAVGTITAGALITLMLQTIKDACPSLSGRAAVAATYGVAIIVTAMLVIQTRPNPDNPDTWVAAFVLALALGRQAQLTYAELFIKPAARAAGLTKQRTRRRKEATNENNG